jgi:hypothetical protein
MNHCVLQGAVRTDRSRLAQRGWTGGDNADGCPDPARGVTELVTAVRLPPSLQDQPRR